MVYPTEIKEEEEERPVYTDGRSSHMRFLLGIMGLLFLILAWLILKNMRFGYPPPPFYIVELDEFVPALESTQYPVIIDIRGEAAYIDGHIPGAQIGETNAYTIFGVPIETREVCAEQHTYFFYSNKGEDYHEVRDAIARTSDRGCWTAVYLLDGGFIDWEKMGLPVE